MSVVALVIAPSMAMNGTTTTEETSIVEVTIMGMNLVFIPLKSHS